MPLLNWGGGKNSQPAINSSFPPCPQTSSSYRSFEQGTYMLSYTKYKPPFVLQGGRDISFPKLGYPLGRSARNRRPLASTKGGSQRGQGGFPKRPTRRVPTLGLTYPWGKIFRDAITKIRIPPKSEIANRRRGVGGGCLPAAGPSMVGRAFGWAAGGRPHTLPHGDSWGTIVSG